MVVNRVSRNRHKVHGHKDCILPLWLSISYPPWFSQCLYKPPSPPPFFVFPQEEQRSQSAIAMSEADDNVSRAEEEVAIAKDALHGAEKEV